MNIYVSEEEYKADPKGFVDVLIAEAGSCKMYGNSSKRTTGEVVYNFRTEIPTTRGYNKITEFCNYSYEAMLEFLDIEDAREQFTEPTEDMVVISLSGGVAELVQRPAGVKVRILDYDVSDHDTSVSRDRDGDPVSIRDWAD